MANQMTDVLKDMLEISANKPKFIYRTIDSFENVAGFIVSVFEQRHMLQSGQPDLSKGAHKAIMARVNGAEEMFEVKSIALAAIIMADKTPDSEGE